MKISLPVLTAILCSVCVLPRVSHGETYIADSIADAFLAAGSPGNPVGSDLTGLNFGGTGNLAVSPASSTKGEFDSVIKFNLNGAVSQYNSAYGAGNWQVTGLSLSLNSNFGTQGAQPGNQLFNSANGGNFNIQWISTNSWVEGTNGGTGGPGFPTTTAVSFQSIPSLLSEPTAALGTFLYTLPGNNVYVTYDLPLNSNLVNNVTAGGDLSLFLTPADNQIGYLLSARGAGTNPNPHFIVTAAPVPVPASVWLFGSGLAGVAGCVRRKQRRLAGAGERHVRGHQ